MMMELEYAKPMTQAEVDQYFQSLENVRVKEYNKSKQTLERYKEQLFAEHKISDDRYSALYSEVIRNREAAEKIKQQKLCICGAPIRFVQDWNFYGCTQYNNTEVDHMNFEERTIENYYKFPVPNGWISDIRTKLGLPKSLRTAHLLHFFLDNGKEDLLLKYNGVDSKDVVYRLTDTKRKATDFEKVQFDIISATLKRCHLQFAIRYRYVGFKEKFAFIDILGSDDKTVYLYECKTSQKDVNICQADEYKELVQRIMDDNNMKKSLVFQYLFEKEA